MGEQHLNRFDALLGTLVLIALLLVVRFAR